MYINKMKDPRPENFYEGEYSGGTLSVAMLIEEGASPFRTIFKESNLLRNMKDKERMVTIYDQL